MGKAKGVLSHSFWVYNKLGGWSKAIKRNNKLKKGYIERVEPPDNGLAPNSQKQTDSSCKKNEDQTN